MKKYIHTLLPWLFYAFIFLLPWQTRWIWHEGRLGGELWEYGSFSLYGTDILLVLILLLSLILPRVRQKGVERFWVLIGALFLISFVSIFGAANKDVAWYGVVRLAEGIAVFWLALRLPLEWKKLGAAFVTSGVVQAMFGIYQFFSQHIVANKWFGLAAHDPGTAGDFVIETASGRWLRAYGAFPHPNVLGGFLVVALIMLIGLIMTERKRLVAVILQSASFAVMLFGLVLTFSRSAWFAFVVAMLFLAGIFLWQRDRWRLQVLSRVGIWIVLVLLFSAVLLPNIWQTRLSGEGRLETISVQERLTDYEKSWSIIEQDWAQGVGIGNYTQAVYSRDVRIPRWQNEPAHNIFVLAATEIGIFGGLIFVFLVVEFLRVSGGVIVRRRTNIEDWFLMCVIIVIALIVIGLFDHYLWDLPFGILIFWMMLGLWVRNWQAAKEGGGFHHIADILFHRLT